MKEKTAIRTQKIRNKPNIGMGVYTSSDVGSILGIDSRRVQRYIREEWDNRFGQRVFGGRYSWDIPHGRGVNFLVLIEMKMVQLLQERGVSIKVIFKAREEMARAMKLPYPFANAKLYADNNRIFFQISEGIVSADGTSQFNLDEMVKRYCSQIEYGEDDYAERLWPRGQQSSIVVDRHRQFGQPIIQGTNINAETIYSMRQSGETPQALARLFGITHKNVNDAVRFFEPT